MLFVSLAIQVSLMHYLCGFFSLFMLNMSILNFSNMQNKEKNLTHLIIA